MDTTEMWKKNADRAMALIEQKGPEQLAVELVEMRDKHTAAMDALSRMQDQRDQLAAQLKDATGQCEGMAELLRELREGAEIHLHNCTVCKNDDGIANWMSKLERIDAALAGKLPELRITKPARIGGVVLQPGNKASAVIEAAYLAAEHHEPNPAAFQALQDAMLSGLSPVHETTEGWQLVPVEPTPEMVSSCKLMLVPNAIMLPLAVATYKTMLAAAPKPKGGTQQHPC